VQPEVPDVLPLRVAHVVLSLRAGGLENGVVNVINGLPPERFVSTVYCLQEAGEFTQRLKPRGCQVRVYGLKPGNDLRLPLRLARDLRKDAIDIVHTRNSEAFFYGFPAARLAGVRSTVHSEHGRTSSESALRRYLQGWMLKRTTCAFAVSRELSRRLEAELGLPEGAFSVLYNGVDLARFTNCDAIPRVRGGAPVTIGAVGRLVEVKNFPLLLRAFAELRKEADVRLLIVGEGPERQALEALAVGLGVSHETQFVGHSEEVARHMQQMDIFVLPSLREGLSNTVLEAMACALPVVASDVGGNGELVADQQTGYLFESGNLNALTLHLRRLAADSALRQRLGAAGRECAHARFAMPVMLAQYADLYDRAHSARVAR